MKVLVACEESQQVCKAFRKKGHEAYSCDLQEESGGHPEWHIKGDAVEAMRSQQWDIVIAHPPCTRLANSGVRWLHKRDLWEDLRKHANFFNEFVTYGREGHKIAIENPIMHNYARAIIPDGYSQIIQPYQFGHTERKATCLWLYGLPKLKETHNVYAQMMLLPKKESQRIVFGSLGKDRAKIRSKTYQGIAEAMADQWGSV